MVETYGTHGGADKCKFAYIRAQVLLEVIASNLVPSSKQQLWNQLDANRCHQQQLAIIDS
jgi:hypothetical protein